jgi:hypothetical protein
MALVHMLTGLGEATITMLVVAAISKTRPELLNESDENVSTKGSSAAFVYGVLVAIGLLLLVAPHATSLPDGLEQVASSLGFSKGTATAGTVSPLKDYQLPGIRSAATATIIAGLVGAVTVFALSFLLARVLTRRNSIPVQSTSTTQRP